MFEVAELGHTIDKKSYEEQVARLRVELLEAQQDLKDAGPARQAEDETPPHY